MEKYVLPVHAVISAVFAWISARLGILFPVLGILLLLMVIDYITGMAASKVEAMDHPEDPNLGWSSKKGAKGILKKVGYICVITVAIILDYIVLHVAGSFGIDVPGKAFFGLLVAIWYVLNEILSITENAGRMGANIPDWLIKYIAVLKNKVDGKGEENGSSE